MNAVLTGMSTIETSTVRDAFARIASPVAIVTTIDEHQRPRGVTVSSVCALSLAPPLLLFCIRRAASTHGALTQAQHFLVNLLHEDQQAVAVRFATSGADRFAGYPMSTRRPPAVPGALALLLCRREATFPGGDHTIVIGRVEDVDLTSPKEHPLLYFDRHYRTLGART